MVVLAAVDNVAVVEAALGIVAVDVAALGIDGAVVELVEYDFEADVVVDGVVTLHSC